MQLAEETLILAVAFKLAGQCPSRHATVGNATSSLTA